MGFDSKGGLNGL
uniref:Uncharacterized protein n=1 Tax=Rhizophora mucronata TaxID=61149 RepID=A0A2P2P2K6_RHIMU